MPGREKDVSKGTEVGKSKVGQRKPKSQVRGEQRSICHTQVVTVRVK